MPVRTDTQKNGHTLPCLFILGLLAVVPTACRQNRTAAQEPATMSPACIIEWNELTYQLAYEHDQFYSFIGVRTLCMVHLAMHDALNAIQPEYEPYAYVQEHPGADAVAAASRAAHDVLVNAYPARADTIAWMLNKWLTTLVADNQAIQDGLDLGTLSARAIIARRNGDGHEKQGDYTPMTKPGDYQYTPGWDNWVLKPDFNYATPFALDTVTQFRSPPPPALTSKEYAKAYNEVKTYGAKGSKMRTADQTQYAHWWAEFAEHSWNRLGRMVTRSHDLSAWQAARLLALINMDIYDIYLASLESKYYYDTWRPYTAMREAGRDGNPETIAAGDWQPEMLTPPWPEYPSAHAAVAAGGAEVLSHVLGTADVSFTMTSTSALPDKETRSFSNLFEASDECANSRIMNGYHFRFATDRGKEQGAAIANHILSNFLRPVR